MLFNSKVYVYFESYKQCRTQKQDINSTTEKHYNKSDQQVLEASN